MKTEHVILKAWSQRRLLHIRELKPPRSSNPGDITGAAHDENEVLSVADNPEAAPSMSALAAAAHLAGMNLEPIMEINCRDRNRIDIQSLVLGALSFGVGAIFVRPGLHQSRGAMPDARNVFDIDPVQAVHVLSTMRREGRFSNGDETALHRPFALGIQINPCSGDIDLKPYIMKKKISAGADFFVTHPVRDFDRLKTWRERMADIDGFTGKPIYVGIPADIEPPSDEYLASNGFAGVFHYAD